MITHTAASHVLGFDSKGLYVASSDHMLHIDFVGSAGAVPETEGGITDDSKVSPLTQVSYTGLWPGVNLSYDAIDKGITRSTWEIAPGADPEKIRLRYSAPLEIEADGSLKINYETGWLRESAPIAWQEINGQRKPVEVAFLLLEDSENKPMIGFDLGQYNPAHPLLIDPTLEWNTFMGGYATQDHSSGIAVDHRGNIYVAGESSRSWGSPKNAHSGSTDAFIAKLSPNGARLWHTFLGSSGVDESEAITVDGNGNAYVTGYSSATWGSPVNAHHGGDDAYVAKLNSSGVRLWHTFMGSTNDDEGRAIAVDNSNRVYLAGSSSATWGSPVNAYAGSEEIFVAKLNSNGTRMWHTFMGSTSNDRSPAITLDSNSAVYVSGSSSRTWGSPKNAYTRGWDAFAAKLNSNGSRLWNTFMGGSGVSLSTDDDHGYGIAVDSRRNIYVTGASDSTWGAPLNAHGSSSNSSHDAFVAKLNPNGVRLWNTFMGGGQSVDGYAVAIDRSDNVYVSGESWSSWGQPVNPPPSTIRDGFAVKLNSNGIRQWNTFFGGATNDYSRSIALDSNDNVYVAGHSDTPWGTPVNPFNDNGFAFEVYVAKLGTDDGLCFPINTAKGKTAMICL